MRMIHLICGAAIAGASITATAQPAPGPVYDPLLLPGDEAPATLERMLRPPRPQPPGGPVPAPVDPTAAPSLAMSMDLAQAIVNTCLAQGIRVGVAITDSKGTLRFGLNADGATPGRIFTAARKGAAVIAFGGQSTAAVQATLRVNPSDPRFKPNMTVNPGGEPLFVDGKLVGAAAASGGTGEQDDACVLAGIASIPALGGKMTAAASPGEAELLAAEDARFAAQIRKDAASVAAGLADDLTYVHAVGRRQTKADYVAALAAGRTDYRSIVPSERAVGVSGNLGWTRAILTQQVGERTMSSSYLAVYTRRSGHWQLLSWQTTPNDAPAGIAPQAVPAGTK